MPKRGKIAIGDIDEPVTEPVHPHVQAKSTDTPSIQPETPVSAGGTPPAGEYEPPPRRPRAERENAFDLGAWLLEGALGIAEEFRHNDLGLPEDFWTHAYTARREALLAARSLIDVALERCEQTPPSRPKRQKQRGNVDINFG